MSIVKPLGSTKMAADTERNIRELRDTVAFRQAGSIDGETTANDLGALLERVSGTSSKEIDNLIGDLHALRKKLQADSNRIQRDIADYASLSQSVMQLTKIVSDSVKKLPDTPNSVHEENTKLNATAMARFNVGYFSAEYAALSWLLRRRTKRDARSAIFC